MRCGNCTRENPEGALFCGGCGQRLPRLCPECGAELGLDPGIRFCFHCGAQVEGSPAAGSSEAVAERLQRLVPREFADRLLAARGQLAGERRIVTILFADVVGSTPMAEKLDPEEVLEIMDGAFDVLIEPITRYEGALARLRGDGILAFFGAPIAHEDDAERACRAALEIIEGAQRYAARLEEERGITGFDVRVGIHTGLVVVGEVGSDLRVEYTAMGDAVNLASRIEPAAEPGTVLITEDTHRLIAPLFETEALGLIQGKGKSEPVAVHRVLAPRAVAGKARGIAGLESPLVGRDAEFRALLEALERLQAGVGGIVTIVGEAGIGKSRLVAELRKEAGSLHLRWVEGRCLSYGESMAYLPWVDMLQGLLGMSVEDPLLAVRDALHQFVGSLCPDHFDEVYPYLGRMMSLPLAEEVEARLRGLEPEGVKVLTSRAVERVLESGTNDGPLVLVCEDLHWADASSLELLDRALTLADRVSLLLICAFRPYSEHGCWALRETIGRLYRYRHTDLWLQPLSAADSEALVGNLLEVEALPRPLRMRILEHAEGNPFYVEEVIRSLIDIEAIVQDARTGHWKAMESVEDVAIPGTLHGVLMARIDRLEEGARRALQVASVIGRIFPYRVLSGIAEGKQELDAQLLTLQWEEMIRERARVPELEYIFKHRLTQEAAYNGLLRSERRQFHRQVAEAMGRLFPDRIEEQLGLLAHHWEQAGERERAGHYLRRAGEQAAAQFANSEAVDYLSRALDLMPQEDLAGRYDLLLAREGVYSVQGVREAQRSGVAALEVLADALDDDRRRAKVALREAVWAYNVPDYSACIAAAQKAVRLARVVGDVRTEAAAHVRWGGGLRLQGQYIAFRTKAEEALALARAAHLRGVEAQCLETLGMGFTDHGDYADGRACYEQSLRIYRETGDRWRESTTLVHLGFPALGQGDFDVARACYEEALPALREIGAQWSESDAHVLAGGVYHALGDFDRARGHYEQELQNCRELSDRRGVTIALCQLSLLSQDLGNRELALEYAQQAQQTVQLQGALSFQGAVLTCLGHALAGLEDLDEAANAYRQALNVLQQLEQPRYAIEALAGLSSLCLAQGELSQAQDHVKDVLRYLEDHTLGNVFLLREPFQVYLTCYRVLRASEDPRAQTVLEEAHSLLEDRAAKISDEEERRSFLENVAANREIVSEYGRRNPDLSNGEAD